LIQIEAVKGGNEGQVYNEGLAFVPKMLEKVSYLVQEAEAALSEVADEALPQATSA
jgi:hypothetical protein